MSLSIVIAKGFHFYITLPCLLWQAQYVCKVRPKCKEIHELQVSNGTYSLSEQSKDLQEIRTHLNWYNVSLNIHVVCVGTHIYNTYTKKNNYRISAETILFWILKSKGHSTEGQRSQYKYIEVRKLFKGGNYSREETIWGNTVG